MIRPGELEPELGELMDATVALFHRLRAAAAELHGQGDLTAARRGVLQGLQRDGDQTVPQMARARPVSRQHIQTLVNALADDGLVELVGNPAHKRSKLVRITDAGRALLRSMQAREAEALHRLDPGIDPWRLREATQVLTELRIALEGERWQEVVNDGD